MRKPLEQLVKQAEVVFWDFDGVIKDSVQVKSLAFQQMFSEYGFDVVNRVRCHHERNGGMSRFEKFPLYLSWANQTVTDEKIEDLCNRFSLLVQQSVIDSNWVDGFLDFFACHIEEKTHILVTATPTEEINEILKALNIRHFFSNVYGAPQAKSHVIEETLRTLDVGFNRAIMLGDSESDYRAAEENNVLFLLRGTDLNKKLQGLCKGRVFKDFING
tara:strand:- start:234 stop:884 length:651 start_codon:yes stop_codon:yes gene_type:complete